MAKPIYENVRVQLSGRDGNAFLIIGRVSGAMKDAGIADDEICKFEEEAMSGDYNGVLKAAMKYVQVA